MEIDIPVSKPAHTLCEITSRLECGIYNRLDIDLGKAMTEEGAEVFWKVAKGVVVSL